MPRIPVNPTRINNNWRSTEAQLKYIHTETVASSSTASPHLHGPALREQEQAALRHSSLCMCTPRMCTSCHMACTSGVRPAVNLPPARARQESAESTAPSQPECRTVPLCCAFCCDLRHASRATSHLAHLHGRSHSLNESECCLPSCMEALPAPPIRVILHRVRQRTSSQFRGHPGCSCSHTALSSEQRHSGDTLLLIIRG